MTVRELDDVILPAGRRLALYEVGDPSGRVAFYFHGTGSSRLEAGLYASAAHAAGVRLVGWDRPGAGGSPAQPGRTLVDVVADTQAVAEYLGVDPVRVTGISGGGSHVLALAANGAPLVRTAVAVNPGPPAEDDLLAILPGQISRFMRLARDHPKAFTVVSQAMQYRGQGKVAELLGRCGCEASTPWTSKSSTDRTWNLTSGPPPSRAAASHGHTRTRRS